MISYETMMTHMDKVVSMIDDRGLNSEKIKYFVDVGEWMLAFEGMHILIRDGLLPSRAADTSIADLYEYFEAEGFENF